MKNNNSFQYGKWGDVAKDFYKNSDAYINIAEGTVRSGKTMVCNARWLKFILDESIHHEFLISGRTISTVRRNVLKPLFQMLNADNIPYEYKRGDHELHILDNTCYVLGFNDESSQDIIAGMTVAGWYGDELTRCPKSAVDMAISRCSLSGAKMFWNMNPDNPYHYLYTDYIKNTDALNEGIIKKWHFTLEDNPNLSKTYVNNLKKLYKNNDVFYKRNILGMWATAEGAIYNMFVEAQHTFTNRIKYDTINICCDYGVSTVTVFGVMAIKYDAKGNTYYLLEEDYYDATTEGKAQSDSERVERIIDLQNKYHLTHENVLFLPHDAASLKAECEQDPRILMHVETYTPNTYEDIKVIQNLFSTNHFFIHTSCRHSIEQAQTYAWDSKASNRGEDKPLKKDDHCPDMWRGGILGHRQLNNLVFGYVDL